MKGSTLIWIGLGLVAAGGGAYFLFKEKIDAAISSGSAFLYKTQLLQNASVNQSGGPISQAIQAGDKALTTALLTEAQQSRTTSKGVTITPISTIGV